MAEETEATRIQRAVDLAYEKGQRDALVDARLNAHEMRLNGFNGQIARVGDRLGGIERSMATNEAIEEALLKVAERTGAKRFTRIQSIGIGVLGSTAVGAFVLSIITALGHG